MSRHPARRQAKHHQQKNSWGVVKDGGFVFFASLIAIFWHKRKKEMDKKSTLTLVGFILFLTGFVGFVVSMIGVQLIIFQWISGLGTLAIMVIQVLMIAGGIAMVILARRDEYIYDDYTNRLKK